MRKLNLRDKYSFGTSSSSDSAANYYEIEERDVHALKDL